ncbi:MAG: type II secretion system protein M [Sterolibacterium sp.]|jgi:MSHA biogenesis protein MshJ|nr:type II secretion system protein M [Sterolibacterium sp.]
MNEKLQELVERFNVLTLRERGIIAGAVLLGGVVVGDLILIEPQLNRKATQTKRIVQTKNDMAAAESQIAVLQAQVKDPDANNRAALQDIRKNMAAVDLRLQNIQESLVPPEKMQGFLENLLSKNSRLSLLALHTLPVVPLVSQVAKTKPDGKDTGKSASAAASGPGDATIVKTPVAHDNAPGNNIYKHAIEIRIAGSYPELTQYLAQLEKMPQRILWERAELKVEKFPRSVLTVTVYTLSLDKQWLTV